MLSERWITAIETVDFAFQPIVNIHTGITFGVEALLRDCELAGFPSIRDFFDTAFFDQCLVEVDLCFVKKQLESSGQFGFMNRLSCSTILIIVWCVWLIIAKEQRQS